MFGKVTKFHGSGLIEAEIIASGLPATMPTTSDGIDNLGDGYTLAPGSTMIVTGADKQYILGDDGTWEEYSAGGGGSSIQVTSLPTASAALVGTIYQYVGTTSGSIINSHFYKCVEGSTSGTYEWVDTMDSTPTENSTNPVTSGGVYAAIQSAGGGGLTLLHSGKVSSVDISNATEYTLIILVMFNGSYGLKSIFAPSLMSGTNSYSLYATSSSGNDTKLADIKYTDTSIIRFSSMSTGYTTNIYGLK